MMKIHGRINRRNYLIIRNNRILGMIDELIELVQKIEKSCSEFYIDFSDTNYQITSILDVVARTCEMMRLNVKVCKKMSNGGSIPIPYYDKNNINEIIKCINEINDEAKDELTLIQEEYPEYFI